jgi:hypothetical protein
VKAFKIYSFSNTSKLSRGRESEPRLLNFHNNEMNMIFLINSKAKKLVSNLDSNLHSTKRLDQDMHLMIQKAENC